jgi:hypothetical protein
MGDMNKVAGIEILLTSDDIRRWQAELQECQDIKAKADQRIGELCTKLDAAALLAGALFPPPATPSATPEAENQETMGDATKRILGTFRRSVFHHELQAELRKIDRFRAMLDKNGGAYYYTMIARLKSRDEIKKTGKKIRLVQKDETPSEETPEGVS